jgi:hypothetical protein
MSAHQTVVNLFIPSSEDRQGKTVLSPVQCLKRAIEQHQHQHTWAGGTH